MNETPVAGPNTFSNPGSWIFIIALVLVSWIICNKLNAKKHLPLFVLIAGIISPALGLIAFGIVSYLAFIGKYGDIASREDTITPEKSFSVYVFNKPVPGEDNLFWKNVASSEKYTLLRRADLFITKDSLQLQIPSPGFSGPILKTIKTSEVIELHHTKKLVSRLHQFILPILKGFATSIFLILFLLFTGKNSFSVGGNILFTIIFGMIMAIVYISIGKENISPEDLFGIIINNSQGEQINFGIPKSKRDLLLRIAQEHKINCREIE